MFRILKGILLMMIILWSLEHAHIANAQNMGIEYVSSTLWSVLDDVKVQGDFAYCAFGCGFAVLDISNPAQPIWIGQKLFSWGAAVDIIDTIAFMADFNTGLKIINVANPASPTLVACVDLPPYTADVFLANGFAYLTNVQQGLDIVDISDLSRPEIIGNCETPGDADQIFVRGNYAYVADRDCGLQIINVADPYNPFIEGNYDTNTPTLGVFVDDVYAYIAVANGDFLIIDIQNPASPECIGGCEVPRIADAVIVRDSLAYIAAGPEGLHVIDIHEPSNPTIICSIDTDDYAISLFLDNNNLYLSDYYSLKIFSLEDPQQIALIGDYELPVYISKVFVEGNYAYAAGRNTLWIVDISDNFNPRPVGRCAFPNRIKDLYILWGYAYIAVSECGMVITDISDPANPVIVSTFEMTGYDFDIFVSQNYAFIADNGLLIINVADPNNPVLIDTINFPNMGLRHLLIKEQNVYAVNGRLYIIDISNIEEPILMGSAPIRGIASDIFVYDQYAYIGEYYGPLQIFDISDASNPYLVSDYSYYENPGYLSVIENYVFIASDDGSNNITVEAVQVSIPSSPTLETEYFCPGFINDIFISNDKILLAAANSAQILHFGLTSIENKIELPDHCFLSPNYPNPFNAATVISYSLPQQSDITLDIYDLLGRRVEMLYNGIQPPGEHSLIWHADGFSSGVYFYKLTAGDFSETKKMMLVR